MRDYAELVKALRYCGDSDRQGCAKECRYGKEHPSNFRCIGFLFADAADAIEELLAENADLNGQVKRSQEEIRKLDKMLAAVPKWISVEKRLPDVAEKVLTYNGDFVSENWLCTVSSKTEIITVWAYSEGFVTHWMPLPAPPKEDANANT